MVDYFSAIVRGSANFKPVLFGLFCVDLKVFGLIEEAAVILDRTCVFNYFCDIDLSADQGAIDDCLG